MLTTETSNSIPLFKETTVIPNSTFRLAFRKAYTYYLEPYSISYNKHQNNNNNNKQKNIEKKEIVTF